MSIRRALGVAVVAAGLMVPTAAVLAQPAAASTTYSTCGGVGAGKPPAFLVVQLVVHYVPDLTLVQQRALLTYVTANPARTAAILNAIAAQLPANSALRAQLQELAARLC